MKAFIILLGLAIGSSSAAEVSCPLEDISPCTCSVQDNLFLRIYCIDKGLEEIPHASLLPLHDKDCTKYPILYMDFSSNRIAKLDNDTVFDGLCLGINSENPLENSIIITFDGNPLVEVHPKLFDSVIPSNSSLHLNFVFCKLKEYPVFDGFLGTYSTIDLSNNDIAKIDYENIHDIQMFISINLSGNKLQVIHNGTFEKFLFNGGGLSNLDLSNNAIEEIQELAFRTTDDSQVHLNQLDLSGNNINHIERNTFKNLGSLNILNLANNNLNYSAGFGVDAFNGIDWLNSLDMSNNPLSLFPSTAIRDKGLGFLRLRNCGIIDLPGGMFDQWRDRGLTGMNLDLSQNRIGYVDKDAFSSAKTNLKLSKIQLDSNYIDDHKLTFLEDPCNSVVLNPSKWFVNMAVDHTHINLGLNVTCGCSLERLIRTSMYSISGTCEDGTEIDIFGDLWTHDDTPYATFEKMVNLQSKCYDADVQCNDYAHCSKAMPASYHAKCSACDVTKSVFTLFLCIVASLGLMRK